MAYLNRLMSTLGVVLTLMAALSFAAAGGAHQFDRADPAAQAIALIYGTDAGYCGDPGGSEPAADCPLCHLTAAVSLPDPALGPIAIELRFVAQIVLPQTQRAADTPLDPAHGTRAPPLV